MTYEITHREQTNICYTGKNKIKRNTNNENIMRNNKKNNRTRNEQK